jgi:hypothetical protein
MLGFPPIKRTYCQRLMTRRFATGTLPRVCVFQYSLAIRCACWCGTLLGVVHDSTVLSMLCCARITFAVVLVSPHPPTSGPRGRLTTASNCGTSASRLQTSAQAMTAVMVMETMPMMASLQAHLLLPCRPLSVKCCRWTMVGQCPKCWRCLVVRRLLALVAT